MQTKLAFNRDPPTSASLVLRLKMCTTTNGSEGTKHTLSLGNSGLIKG